MPGPETHLNAPESERAGGARPLPPTHLLGTPGLFGVRYKAKWKPPPELGQVSLAAPYLQRRAACAVLDELVRVDRQIEDFAAAVGADPRYQERKLHGHVRADVEDLGAWALELGPGMLPALDDDDLLPPT